MKTRTPKYDQESKERARYARNLADLLWRKASSQMTPEARELVLECMHIHEMAARVVPEDVEQVNYTFEYIAEAAEKAEELLIACPSTGNGLQWNELQDSLKENEVESVSV
jgi:hypothetical protein